MKTQEDLQAAVDELRAVCRRRGVVLIGTCENESIYGEIAIAESNAEGIGWVHPETQLTNRVEHGAAYFQVLGIGDVTPNAELAGDATAGDVQGTRPGA